MSKKDRITIIIAILGFAGGMYFKTFLGGMVSGFCLCLILFSILGKILYSKAARRMDKKTEEIINGEDG